MKECDLCFMSTGMKRDFETQLELNSLSIEFKLNSTDFSEVMSSRVQTRTFRISKIPDDESFCQFLVQSA